MKVFISIRVPRPGDGRAEIVQRAVDATVACGHQPFVAYQEIIHNELKSSLDFMPFVRQHMRDSDLLLLLYDTELRGGLIEEGIAYALGVPVWLCHRRGAAISSSALGCAARVIEYGGLDELVEMLSRLLSAS